MPEFSSTYITIVSHLGGCQVSLDLIVLFYYETNHRGFAVFQAYIPAEVAEEQIRDPIPSRDLLQVMTMLMAVMI